MLLYIDPGTGSMLFSLFIGLAAAGIYFLRGLFIKIKFVLSGGKEKESTGEALYKFVIFAESKRYWNVFEPICDVFEKKQIMTGYYTMSSDDPVFNRGYQYIQPVFIGEGNKAFAKLNFMKADIVLATTPGLNVLQWKRSKDVKWYVHILHATGSITGYRMFGLDYYDAVLLSGEFQETELRRLENMRGIPQKEICFVGQTYLDRMIRRLNDAPAANRNNKPSKRTVLLAPSWGPSSILCRFGEKILKELKSTGYDIIIRPHPQSFTADKDIIMSLMNKFPESETFHWNRDVDNFSVLNQSDIMITDFSGVIYDYTLVFDRPIIYAETSFDDAPYDSCWLDEPRMEFQLLPKLGRKLTEENFHEIGKMINEVLLDDTYKMGRDLARRLTWMHQGEAAERVVNYLVDKHKQLTEK